MTAAALDVFHCPLDGINLIEASAGTGKTWNLCGLYLRLLLERRLELPQILVVTFTEAATAELRERIRSRLVETLARLREQATAAQATAPGTGGAGASSLREPGPRADPRADPFVDTLLDTLAARPGFDTDDATRRLDHAVQTFDEASIFTIHGFCQRALDDAPFSAGLALRVELLADDGALRLEAVRDFWRRRVAGDALSPALASHLLDQRDSAETWSLLLQRQLAKPLSRAIWPAALDAPGGAAHPDENATLAELAAVHAQARTLWARERERIVGHVTEALPRLNGTRYKASAIAEAAASWDLLLAFEQPLDAPAKLPKLALFGSASLKPKAKLAPPEPHPFFLLAQALLDLREAAASALALARLRLLRTLLDEAPRQLRAAKRDRRVVAFDDMLFNLHDRLSDRAAPPLAAALRARFPAALIDEFQDTDPLQFAIFDAIYGRGDAPLFFIGDPKQAIYSFRHADLHTYLAARARAGAEYTLLENQRSTAPLIGALNALFSANPRAFMLDGLVHRPVGFGSRPRPRFDDRSGAPRAALQLWSLPGAESGGEPPLHKPLAQAASANACAAEIARLLGAGRAGEITLGERALAAGDIAVLVRSHRQGALMRAALAAAGVGSVELSQASVFDSAEAEALLRVLGAVLEPARERRLRAALATELLGFDAAALEALASDEAGTLAAMARFAGYRDTWLQRGVGVMLRSLTRREAVAERLLARADGERRLTNLLHLAELLHEAAAQHAAPEALLRWLQGQRRLGGGDGGGEAAQLRLESDRNLVQIVTVHKAKGLEYPVVFCPFLWDGHAGPNARKLDGLVYRDEHGDSVIDHRTLDAPALAAIKQQFATERAAEGLRLVYVALTRAVQRCYLVVGPYTSGAARKTTESSRALPNWLAAGAGTAPGDWLSSDLGPAALDAAWRALAEAEPADPAHPTEPAQIGLAPLPRGPLTPLASLQPAAASLAAREPPRQLPGAWWIGSYSSLAHGARADAAAVDHDARVAPPTTTDMDMDMDMDMDADPDPDAEMEIEMETPSPSPPRSTAPAHIADDDILRFPRGALAGECLHALFERVDFTQPAGWPAAIDAALAFRPQPVTDPATAAHWPGMLANLLGDVMHTPLPSGGTLAEVPSSRRLVELEFNLPAHHLDADRLAAVLRAHGQPVPALTFSVLSGYLRGFIDLVFEQGGRFYIVDWKSNHLGDTPADYDAAALRGAMVAHGYHLQALLYGVALHRHLRQRLPGYRFEAHFGGALYLFVRGVRPGWRSAGGAPSGVHAEPPSRALIEALSALLEPMEPLQALAELA